MKPHLSSPNRRFLLLVLALGASLGCNLPLAGLNLANKTQAVPTPAASPAATLLAPQQSLPTAIPSTATSPAPAASENPAWGLSAQWPQVDPVYRLVVEEASLAQGFKVEAMPAVPVNQDGMLTAAHPAYVRFGLEGYAGGLMDPARVQASSWPPQVLFFQTQDFPAYGEDTQAGFSNQLKELQAILQNGVDPQRCQKPLTGPADVDVPLPFLPWVNAAQVFCAQPQVISFQGGRGLRYLTYYAQGVSPVEDTQVFYTFQGISDNGRVYVAAMFPIQTGIFPEKLEPNSPEMDINALTAALAGQVGQLNSQPPAAFHPALSSLDAMIGGITVK